MPRYERVGNRILRSSDIVIPCKDWLCRFKHIDTLNFTVIIQYRYRKYWQPRIWTEDRSSFYSGLTNLLQPRRQWQWNIINCTSHASSLDYPSSSSAPIQDSHCGRLVSSEASQTRPRTQYGEDTEAAKGKWSSTFPRRPSRSARRYTAHYVY